MKFAHDEHKQVFDDVAVYLSELFEEPFLDEETGHYYVRYGSTVVEIGVETYGPEEVLVLIVAYCVQGADVDDELMSGLLELNHNLPVGAFSVVDEDIFFSYSLFGRDMRSKDLLSGIAAVANISDEYDDKLSERFGGNTALDRIRYSGGRAQRKARREAERARSGD